MADRFTRPRLVPGAGSEPALTERRVPRFEPLPEDRPLLLTQEAPTRRNVALLIGAALALAVPLGWALSMLTER